MGADGRGRTCRPQPRLWWPIGSRSMGLALSVTSISLLRVILPLIYLERKLNRTVKAAIFLVEVLDVAHQCESFNVLSRSRPTQLLRDNWLYRDYATTRIPEFQVAADTAARHWKDGDPSSINHLFSLVVVYQVVLWV